MLADSEEGRCQFSERAEDGVLDETWECPHRRLDDDDRCIYHSSDTDGAAAALVRDVNTDYDDPDRAARGREFVGARFGDLRLDRRVLDAADEHPIDLRKSTVEGTLSLSGTAIRHEFRADGATIEGDLAADRCRFERPASFSHATVDGDVTCSRATFHGEAGFYGTTIAGEASFTEARFERSAMFQRVRCRDAAAFDRATFADGFAGLGATFEDRLQMPGIESAGEIRLVEATLAAGGNFTNATVEDGVLLRSTVIEDAADVASKPGVSPLDFSHATVERLQLDPDHDASITVRLREATVRAGRLASTADGTPTYDLGSAVIGNVTLEGPFGAYRTAETTYEGFDFTAASSRAPLVDDGWRVAPDVDGELDPAAAESTYLKLKNGASEVGADRVASEFFRRERIARRRVYRSTIRDREDGSLVRPLGAWVANFALGATTGHGERPSRVIGTSVLTVLGFALTYRYLWEGPPPYGHWSGHLLLSLESFVTLVLAGGERVGEPWWIRFVAEVEGFLGVFLVALFVFTLTRSVHR